MDPDGPLVRLFKPKVILMPFHGTIAPLNWEDESIEPYVRKNLHQFLQEKWLTAEVSNLIWKIKDQSFDEHFVFEHSDCPLVIGYDDFNGNNCQQMVDSVTKFILWQLDKSRKISQDVRDLIKLCWIEGFCRRQIKAIIFDDVKCTLTKWKTMDIQLAIITKINEDTLRMILSSTTVGDLSDMFDYYINPDDIGNDYGFYDRLADNIFHVQKKQILLISDSGQDVKRAYENKFQSLVIKRPGDDNKFRTYYLIRYPFTTNLKFIEFI